MVGGGEVAATVLAALRYVPRRNLRLRGAAAWVYIRAPAKARGRRRLEEESFTLFVCVDMRPERRKRALRVPLHPLSTLRVSGWPGGGGDRSVDGGGGVDCLSVTSKCASLFIPVPARRRWLRQATVCRDGVRT